MHEGALERQLSRPPPAPDHWGHHDAESTNALGVCVCVCVPFLPSEARVVPGLPLLGYIGLELAGGSIGLQRGGCMV